MRIGDETMIKKLTETVKKVPWWGWVFGIVYFGLQYGMYRLGHYLSIVIGTIDRAWECKLPLIDDLIPLIPAFVVIYVFSYVFWIFGPVAVSLTKKEHFKNYIIGLSLAYLIGFLFFIFLPTYMDRVKEGLMDLSSRPGFFYGLLATVYGADGSDLAFNLFPSYHCLISFYCYLGVRRQPEISKGFRVGHGAPHLVFDRFYETALYPGCCERHRDRGDLLCDREQMGSGKGVSYRKRAGVRPGCGIGSASERK